MLPFHGSTFRSLAKLLSSRGFAGVIIRLMLMYFFMFAFASSLIVLLNNDVHSIFNFKFLFYYDFISKLGNLFALIYSLIITVGMFLLTGERETDTKIIVNFLNKSIIPFIAILALFGNISLSDNSNFSLITDGNTINFSTLCFQLLPTVLVISYNAKLAYFEYNKILRGEKNTLDEEVVQLD